LTHREKPVPNFALSLFNLYRYATFLLPQLRQRKQNANFYAMNIRMYLSLTFYLSTFFLIGMSPPVMDLILTTTVYEPRNVQNYVMSACYMFAHMKMCYDDYIVLHSKTILSFLSLSLIPGAYAFFLYRFANKYGEHYYTGDTPVPTAEEFFSKQISWWGCTSLIQLTLSLKAPAFNP
jgi:hypothetical protein